MKQKQKRKKGKGKGEERRGEARREKTGVRIRKKENYLIHGWHDSVCITSMNPSKKRLLKLINEFMKATWYKVDIHNLIIHLYAINEHCFSPTVNETAVREKQ